MRKPEDFHRRLKQACDDSRAIPPYGHGRQAYLATKLKVTPEAVRKWFSNEARPRPDKMRQLAKLLEVDEAWLSLGITPELDRASKRRHAQQTDGAVYVLYGLFTLAGGHCAFPSERDPRREYVDFYTIIHGDQMAIHACAGRQIDRNHYEFVIPHEWHDVRCVGVVPLPDMQLHVIDLDAEALEHHLSRKAGGYAVQVEYAGGGYRSDGDNWPRIERVADL